MALRFVGQWRKGVLWPAALVLQIIFLCCFDATICAGSFLIAVIGASMIATKLCLWLASLHASKTMITTALVSYLVVAHVFFQRVPYILITFAAIDFVIFLLDVLFRETEHLIHWFRPKPVSKVPCRMERVASLRSAGNGYHGQFHPVIICDGDWMDDPFWPDHASIVHCFEIRWHSVFWREVVLWRVSLLNGYQRELASFHQMTFNRRIVFHGDDHRQFTSFQSRGVIFILEFGGNDSPTLTVFDTRFGKSKLYEGIGSLLGYGLIQLIRLRRRLFDPRGRLEGWTIQVIFPCITVTELWSWKMYIRNVLCDLREKIALVKNDDIKFGHFTHDDLPMGNAFRTNDNSFGFQVFSNSQNMAMVFNLTHNCYRYFATVEERNQAFSQIWYLSDGPVILNERECVQLKRCGRIYWKAFVPATMKYIAAKAFFRSNPGPLNRITAAQFRQITGVDMEGQFPIQNAGMHHVWIRIPGIL